MFTTCREARGKSGHLSQRGQNRILKAESLSLVLAGALFPPKIVFGPAVFTGGELRLSTTVLRFFTTRVKVFHDNWQKRLHLKKSGTLFGY